MILYLYKYNPILPCPVTNVVKFGVTLIFSVNLSAILGKYLIFMFMQLLEEEYRHVCVCVCVLCYVPRYLRP